MRSRLLALLRPLRCFLFCLADIGGSITIEQPDWLARYLSYKFSISTDLDDALWTLPFFPEDLDGRTSRRNQKYPCLACFFIGSLYTHFLTFCPESIVAMSLSTIVSDLFCSWQPLLTLTTIRSAPFLRPCRSASSSSTYFSLNNGARNLKHR